MANNVGRPRGLPKAPGSGRKPGTRNSKPRTPDEIRERIRLDIIAAYEAEGGVEWLKKIIHDHPLAFLSQAFSRIAPVPPKPEETLGGNTVVNIGAVSNFEAARYIAFALAQAVHDEMPVKTIEHEPTKIEKQPPREPLPPYEPPTATPEPAIDIENLRNEDLIRDTHEKSLETYQGNPAEMGRPRRNLI